MVGEKAGTSKNSVLRAEHEGEIRPLTARKIAEALGVEVADLLLEEVESPTPKGQPSPQHEGKPRGRRDWRAEVEAFAREADEIIDAPDLTREVCGVIMQEGSNLWLELYEERKDAKRPEYGFKELNDLAAADEALETINDRVRTVYLNRFGKSEDLRRAEKAREGIRKATDRISNAG
ncbi:MAG: hypothetical protein M3N18_03660 [Actinomycetota bacterium]|nr:hypothetical protein [Actinomycetota bacterium]